MVKAFFKSKFGKGYTMAVTALMIMVVMAVPAFAAETVDKETVTAITNAFSNVKATALACLAAIGGVAILLFAGIYAWRYGKKVFSVIAK